MKIKGNIICCDNFQVLRISLKKYLENFLYVHLYFPITLSDTLTQQSARENENG